MVETRRYLWINDYGTKSANKLFIILEIDKSFTFSSISFTDAISKSILSKKLDFF